MDKSRERRDCNKGVKNVVQNFLTEVDDGQSTSTNNKEVDKNEEPDWKKYVEKKRPFTLKQICGR